MDVQPPPSSSSSKHSASKAELTEQARNVTNPASSAGDIVEERRTDAASDASGASSHEHLTKQSQQEPSPGPPGGVNDAPRNEPAAATTVPFPQDLLTKLIDALSKLEPPEKLSGWAGIEGHLFKHDTEEMEYYGKDIDTLLVFAGLFSAFLTAFVVQTYPMLIDDDSSTTNQLLALSVSMQIRSTGTIIPSTVNSTLTSLIDAQPFSPPTSVRAINILFFLSLVLSLSAALFGILAKQWLREYLRWNSPLALPRENVLVRQDRFEAWKSWNVDATISSIPAILELAMVLFLCGVMVLLWTLDNIVAIIITVFSALFLVAAAMFTLLPIIYKRCPYKSPTAWACVAACQAMRRLFIYVAASFTERWGELQEEWDNVPDDIKSVWKRLWYTIQEYNQAHFSIAWPHILSSWRDRDLESCREVRGKLSGKSHRGSKLTSIAAESAKEVDPMLGRWSTEDLTLADWVLEAIAETALLLRALDWVKLSSQDLRVQTYIAECAESGCTRPLDPIFEFDAEDRCTAYLVVWRTILLAMQQNLLGKPHTVLEDSDTSENQTGGPGLSDSDNELVRQASQYTKTMGPYRRRSFAMLLPMEYWDEGCTASTKELVGQCMVADLKRVIGQNDEHVNLIPSRDIQVILRHLVSDAGTEYPWYTEALRFLFNVTLKQPEKLKHLYEPICLELATYGRLTITSDDVLVLSDEDTTAVDTAALLLQWFNEDFATASEEYFRVFFLIAERWLKYRQLRTTEQAHFEAILHKLSLALDAFAANHTSETFPAAWGRLCHVIWSLRWKANGPLTESSLRCTEFRRVAHACERIYLFNTAYITAWHIHSMLDAAHKGIDECDQDTDCIWYDHHCDVDDDDDLKLPAALEEKCPALRAIRERSRQPPRSSAPSPASTPPAMSASPPHESPPLDGATGIPSHRPSIPVHRNPRLQQSRTQRETDATWWRRLAALPSVAVSHVAQWWTSLAGRAAADVGGSQPPVGEDIAMQDVEAAGGDGADDSGAEVEDGRGEEDSEGVAEDPESAVVLYGDPNVV